METITPFKNLDAALTELDNGGRFYNLFTNAEDGIITQAEIEKKAQIFLDPKKSILFFELAISKLAHSDKTNIRAMLDPALQDHYEKNGPQHITSNQINKQLVGSNVILTGVPSKIEISDNFEGYISVPILVGEITTFTKSAMSEYYSLFTLNNSSNNTSCIIGIPVQSKVPFPKNEITIGGVVKSFYTHADTDDDQKYFIEVSYLLTE